MKYYLAITAFICIIGFAFWMEYKTWSECLDTNTFWYCMRILNR